MRWRRTCRRAGQHLVAVVELDAEASPAIKMTPAVEVDQLSLLISIREARWVARTGTWKKRSRQRDPLCCGRGPPATRERPATRSRSTSGRTTRCCDRAETSARPRGALSRRGGRACTSAPRTRIRPRGVRVLGWRGCPTASRASAASSLARAARSSSPPASTSTAGNRCARAAAAACCATTAAAGVRRVGVRHRRPGADPHRVPDRVEQDPRAPADRPARRRRPTLIIRSAWPRITTLTAVGLGVDEAARRCTSWARPRRSTGASATS